MPLCHGVAGDVSVLVSFFTEVFESLVCTEASGEYVVEQMKWLLRDLQHQ